MIDDLSIPLGHRPGQDPSEPPRELVIPGWEMWVTTSRASGPGGQHVNKTNSRVTLHWAIERTTALSDEQRARVIHRLAAHINEAGVLSLSVDSERSQHRNREIARERLTAWVQQALVRQKHRVPTRPTKGAARRRLDTKRRRSTTKKLRGQVDGSDA